MKHNFNSICKMLDEVKPWFYPTGLAVWVKTNSYLLTGEEESGLMWNDMDDTEGWKCLITLTEKPDICHHDLILKHSGFDHVSRYTKTRLKKRTYPDPLQQARLAYRSFMRESKSK